MAGGFYFNFGALWIAALRSQRHYVPTVFASEKWPMSLRKTLSALFAKERTRCTASVRGGAAIQV